MWGLQKSVAMTEDELQTLLEKTLPPADLHGLFVEECRDDVRLRFSPGPDGQWSSAALRAASGLEAALTHLNVTVLKPAQAADVIALARVIRRDGPSLHAEAWLFSHAVVDPMLHATATLKRP
jgi:hypothetical protein